MNTERTKPRWLTGFILLGLSGPIIAGPHARRRKVKKPVVSASAPGSATASTPAPTAAAAPTPAPRVESALLAVFPDEQYLRISGLKDLGEGRVQLLLFGGGTLEISVASLKEITYEEITLRPENLPVPRNESEALPPFAVPPALEPLIRAAARKAGLDYKLVVSLIKAESNFNPVALSHKGAQGLMQLMPAAARRFGVAHPFIPAENLDGGCAYLKFLLVRYPGNLDFAIAAYNAGEGAVDRHAGIPPFRETQDYVKRINGYMNSFKPTLSPAPPPGMTTAPGR